MINGFSGMGLNELVGALSRSKHGNQSGGRNIQPMPRLDTVQFSPRSRELASASQVTTPATDRPHVAERPVATEKPAQPVEPAAELSMMDRLKAAFFTQTGDDNFDASVDLNGDGRVNNADLAAMREQDKPLDPKEMLQRMQESIFTRAGGERFDAAVDLNSDGMINFADMAMLRSQMDATVTRPPPEPVIPAAPVKPAPARPDPVVELDSAVAAPHMGDQASNTVSVDSIRSAFFSQAGDESFNAAADINGDGRINFADLAEFKSG